MRPNASMQQLSRLLPQQLATVRSCSQMAELLLMQGHSGCQMRSVKVPRYRKGVSVCMWASVQQKSVSILQIEASWQYLCACIQTAEHASNNDRVPSPLFFCCPRLRGLFSSWFIAQRISMYFTVSKIKTKTFKSRAGVKRGRQRHRYHRRFSLATAPMKGVWPVVFFRDKQDTHTHARASATYTLYHIIYIYIYIHIYIWQYMDAHVKWAQTLFYLRWKCFR